MPQADQPGDPLWVEYSRFGHLHSPTELRFHMGRQDSRDGRVRLFLNQDYLEKIDIKQITPEPDAVEIMPAGLSYVFRQANPMEPGLAVFRLESRTAGILRARPRLASQPPLTLKQFFYP